MGGINGYTVKEMHIEVVGQLQRQGSYRKDKLFEQQIDWRLNTGQERIIKSKIKPNPQNPARFEIDQKSVSDIQRIIKPNTSLRVYQDTSERGYSILPSDYLYLVNDRSNIIEECDEEEFTNPLETATFQLRVVKLVSSALSAGPYYKTLSVVKNTVAKALTTVGFSSKEDKPLVIDPLMKLFKDQGYSVYWETWGDVYRPSSFLVVVDTLSDNISIQIDGTTTEVSEIISKSLQVYKDQVGIEVANRCYMQSYVFDALDSSYMKTIPTSPVTGIAEGKIYSYFSKKFLVSKILIDYIRKPRRISLSLDSSCELAGSVHQEVCDIAVELLKRDIEAKDYQLKVQDNVIRSNQ